MKQIKYLEKGWYRESEIPKKNNKVRKICCPSLDLLKYQQSQLKKIEKIYFNLVKDTPIENTAHGFLSGRNCVTAASKHIGFQNTIIIDIKDFFDDVKKYMFNNEKTKEIYEDENLFHNDGYCAQGFATSPILANIAIIDAIKEIKEFLNEYHKDNEFTIYADDLHISINNEDNVNKYIIEKSIIFKVSAVLARYGFYVNSKKTRILRAKFGYRKILGINVGNDHIRASRKTMRKIRAARHQKNGQSLGGLVTWSRCYFPKKKSKKQNTKKVIE